MFLYDLTSDTNMFLYKSLKGKGEPIDNRDEIITDISKELFPLVKPYDHIFIPESSSDFLYKVTKDLGKKITIVNKNNMTFIREQLRDFSLQRSERKSHESEMESMGDTFKVNKLKANHRKHYINHLFVKCHQVQNSVIIDDSNFSGSTREALIKSTGTSNYIAIFSKEKI